MPRPLLITRPEPDASDTIALCEERGLYALAAPVMHIVPLTPPTLPAYDAIILTSPHALSEHVIDRLQKQSLFHVVGKRAAHKVRAYGHNVATVCENAHELSRHLLATQPAGQTFLYLSGEHISLDMGEQLSLRQITCERVVTYKAPALPRLLPNIVSLLGQEPFPRVFFGSKRAVQIFTQLHPHVAPLEAACLSRPIAEAATRAGFGRCISVATPSISQLLDEIARTDCMNP